MVVRFGPGTACALIAKVSGDDATFVLVLEGAVVFVFL